MTTKEYQKREIAHSHLEAALELYFAGDRFFSALHLAGAAEEIFGKELQALDRPNVLDTDQAATSAISQALTGRSVDRKVVADIANRARNAVKHLDPGGPRTVAMDPKAEAEDMLDRAITNYWRLFEDQSPAMQRFLSERYGRRR